MASSDATRPDRPIPSWMIPVRAFVRWTRLAVHRLRLRGKLQVGKNVVFAKAIELRPPERIVIADNVYIGPWFLTETNLEIGPDVLISSRVSCIGNDHAFDEPGRTIVTAGRMPPCTVMLEGDNLIGFGSVIVGNIRIGRGCIVGAGSVVTRDLPPDSVCAGVPAKVIRQRYPEEKSIPHRNAAQATAGAARSKP